MRICHVSKGVCPRTVKLAWAQENAGISTSVIISNQPPYQKTWPFSEVLVADDRRFGGYQRAVLRENLRNDLFHVHTHMLDAWILEDVRRWADIPVVWDAHDEPVHFDGGKGKRLTPTECYEGTVYRTYCPRDWFPPPFEAEYHGVLASGLSDLEGHWRNWLPILKTFKEYGLNIRCYTQSAITKEYEETAEMIGAIDVRDLIVEEAKAGFGICGSAFDDKRIREAHPNKLYEYVAAGIPVICFGEETKMAEVIQTHGLGIVLSGYDNDNMLKVLEFMEESERYRDQVLSVRGRFVMESQEQVVRKFYDEVLSG